MNRRWLVLSVVLGLAGCSGSSSTPTGEAGLKPGPHGGVAVPLAGGKAYAEVKVENTGGSKAGTKSRLVVFFLEPDLKSPLASAPSGVTAKVIPPVGEPASLTLALEAQTKDPLAKQKFVSPPGQYDFDELKGEITATVDGQSETQSFAFH